MHRFILASCIIAVSVFFLSNCADQKPTEQSYEDELKKGRDIALAAKAVLGENLATAIQDYGVDGAVDFYNVQASHLTDIIASELNALRGSRCRRP